MSQHTLESRAHSCHSLAAGAEACARIGGMQLFKGMSRDDLQRKLQVGFQKLVNPADIDFFPILFQTHFHQTGLGYDIL